MPKSESHEQRIRMKLKQCLVAEIKAIKEETHSNELLPELRSGHIVSGGLSFTVDFLKYINEAFAKDYQQQPSKIFMRELRAQFGHDK